MLGEISVPGACRWKFRPLVKSVVWTGTNKVVCTAMEKTIMNTPDMEGLESGSS
jgi:hypothetical protein